MSNTAPCPRDPAPSLADLEFGVGAAPDGKLRDGLPAERLAVVTIANLMIVKRSRIPAFGSPPG